MPFTISDLTVSSQRLVADNSSNWNIGAGTPTSSLSVQGNPVVVGSALAPNTVTSDAVTRYVGSISIPANGTATVSGAGFAGIGSVSNGGILYAFSVPSSFSIANPSTTTAQTFSYAVI
jgi:hypothetical protein